MRARSRRGEDPFVEVEAELRAIYREVDEVYAGHSCPGSADCCKFAVTGREPYVTSVEAELVARAIARSGRNLAAVLMRAPSKRRSLPTVGEVERATEERWCPLLSEGRCTVYADRPFGCRSFYCDRATPGRKVKQAEVNDFVRRLKDLALRHATAGARGASKGLGDQGTPLTRALAAR